MGRTFALPRGPRYRDDLALARTKTAGDAMTTPAYTVQTWHPPTTRVVSVALLQKVHDLIARQEHYDDEVHAALVEIDAIIKLPPL